MAYLAKADRKATLLKAAIAVLRREGPTAVTTRAVATEAGTSVGLLHHHFPTTAGVRCAAFEAFAAEDFAAMQNLLVGLAPEQALLALLDEVIPVTGREPHWRIWCEAWDVAQGDAVFAAAYLRASERWRDLMGELLAAVAGHDGFDSDAAAWRLFALADGLIGFALLRVNGAPAITLEKSLALLRTAVEHEVGRKIASIPASRD